MSRRCPQCGHTAKENRPTRDKFHCVSCGHQAHADTVGALNVLRAGLVRREAQPAQREAPALGWWRSHKHRRARAVLCCVGQRRVTQLVERHLPPRLPPPCAPRTARQPAGTTGAPAY
ncbi:zinc ribbon domain-containing protein [Streptomyces sp. NPDC056352]|uniref:zinc ribbon domain-containing protein n=1 Tax=Streptomyces sp. NPDC056352 TaxID=3345791 RepID=UPI0035DD9577